jgi:hypothetical protein
MRRASLAAAIAGLCLAGSVSIAFAQTVPGANGWTLPPSVRSNFAQLTAHNALVYPDGSYAETDWNLSDFRDRRTGETGTQVGIQQILRNWLGVRYMNCSIPGKGVVEAHVNGSYSFDIVIDVAANCWQSGSQWVTDPDTGEVSYQEWLFPPTVTLSANFVGPDLVETTKGSLKTVKESTNNTYYRHCNGERALDFGAGGFTIMGAYRAIGVIELPNGNVRTTTGTFESEDCTVVGQQ